MNDPIRIADYDGIIREVLESDGEFRLYPRGTSMLPLLRQGIDSVVLQRLDADPRAGDILFYQRSDGSYVLHRVYRVTARGLTLWGDNHMQLEQDLPPSQVIGRVCRIYRRETAISPDSPGYRLYVGLWQCRWLRRMLLPVCHILQKL